MGSDNPNRIDQLIAARRAGEVAFAANTRTGLFLALSGVRTDQAVLSFDPLQMTLEQLPRHPVIRASESTLSALPMHQLAFPDVSFSEHGWALDGIFWTVSAMLRLRCGGYFLPCEIAQYPWDAIDGVPADAPDPRFVLRSHRAPWWPDGAIHVSQTDVEWVGRHFMDVVDMRSDERFHFALECFDGAFEERDVRMAISKAWAGIEGILGISSELRFRIALYVATIVAEPGAERVDTFRATAKLYDRRSKVVHGSTLTADELRRCVVESLSLLGRLIGDAIAFGSVRSSNAIEDSLLGGA